MNLDVDNILGSEKDQIVILITRMRDFSGLRNSELAPFKQTDIGVCNLVNLCMLTEGYSDNQSSEDALISYKCMTLGHSKISYHQ